MGLYVMRANIVHDRRCGAFLKALLCFTTACLLCATAMLKDDEESNSPRGWGMEGIFIGVSVSMIQCLVVLLFFTLWMVTFTNFVAYISKCKSFSALVERYDQRTQKDEARDDSVDEQHQLAKVVATQPGVRKPLNKKQGALGVMKVMGSVLHHRELTKKSLLP